MRNSKKTLTALGIAGGIASGTALISVGVLLSLHNSFKPERKQTYFFKELQQQVIETSKALDSVPKANLNNQLVQELKSEIAFANQLLSNEDSSIALMLEQRNKLKQLTPKTLLSVTTDRAEIKTLINEYYSLVKAVDFQSEAKDAKDKVLSALETSTDKQNTLNSFYNFIDPLIERSNQFSFELETKIWTNHEQLIKQGSTLFSAQEKSALFSTIEQILNLLNQPEYSRDAVLEYEKVYDQMVAKLSSNKAQENKNLNNFLENVIRVRNEISILNLSDSLKDNFLKRIDDYKNIALNPVPKLAITKADEIVYLNDLVNNQLKTLIAENPDKNKLVQTLTNDLDNLRSSQIENSIAQIVQMQIDKIQHNPQENEIDLLNSIAQATNLSSTIKNLENLIKTIKSRISEYLAQKNLNSNDASSFEKTLSEIIGSNFDNINEYLSKLNDLYNDIYDNVLLGLVFKNSLKALNNQILEAQNKGRDVNKNVLARMSSKLLSLLNSNPSVKELNDALREQSNALREINRAELKSWFKASNSILEAENAISVDVKDKLTFLNSQAAPLIANNSTAIREELQSLIRQYRSELEKANISDGLQKTLSEFSSTKDALFGVFSLTDGKINSPFGNKLFTETQELKKQAEITAQNPNLTPLEKETRFTQIQTQFKNIAQNAENFDNLEQAVSAGEKTIQSSAGKNAEQTFLETETLQINQVKTKILDALNNAGNISDLGTLLNQMNEAISDYKTKQAEYQSKQALQDNFNEINQIFAPYSLNGAPTPVQKKILNKLSEYQGQLSNTSITNEQRAQINSNIAKLMGAVLSAKDLEVKNNALKALIDDTESTDYGTFKPQDEYNKAKALNSSVNTYLTTLFNPNFDKNEINTKVNELENQYKALGLSISIALLRKTNDQIQDNRINTANLRSTSPYSEINTSIESINTLTNDLINTPNKTQAQVDELENKIKKYLKLAKALNKSATKLGLITQTDNPITYQALKDSIINKPSSGTANEPTNTLIHYGDSVSVIDFKTRILTDELDKTETRLNGEGAIKTLQAVYTQNEQNQAIFDDAIAAFNTKIADYKTRLAEFYSSKSNLGTLVDDIKFFTAREQTIKHDIQKAWDDVIALKTNMETEYNARKMADGLTNIPKTMAIFTEFETLKNATDTNGKKTTLTNQLQANLDLLPLAYAQDLFSKSSAELNGKLNPLSNYSNEVQTNYSNNWKTAITHWNEAIKNTVNSYTDLRDQVQIKKDYQKISALSSLIAQLNVIFTYFDKNSKTSPNQKNYQVLQAIAKNASFFTKINSANSYSSLDTSALYAQTPESIVVLRNELRDLYFDAISLEDAKASQDEKINNYKTAIDTKLAPLTDLDPALKIQIDNKLNELKNQVNSVTNKSDLIAIDNALSAIQFKEENLKQLATTVKRAKDLATTNNTQSSAGKQSILQEIQTAYNAYENDYLSIDSVELIAKEKQLEDKITLFTKFTQVYDQVTNDKNGISAQYVNGTGTHGTGSDGMSKMRNYYDSLTNNLDTAPINQNKLFTVSNTLAALKKLIALQEEKIHTQNQVLQDNSYNNFAYKTGATNANYGFTTDAQHLADEILKSIPTTNQSATDIETTLYPTLVNSFENVYQLYQARKRALDFIYKNVANASDNGIKTQQVDQLNTQGNANLDPQYQNLKTKADDFFHAQAENIKNATDIAGIDQAILQVVEFNVFFNKYKKIAELVAIAKAEKTSVQSMNANISSNANVTGSLAKLDDEINKGESYFYTQKDNALLDSNIFFLDTYVARVKLAILAAQKIGEVEDFSTNSADTEYLTANAKIPLKSIINSVFTDLNNNSNLETKENYDILKEKYITGSSNSSFNIAFVNSKILQANIHKAQEYLDKYKTQLQTNSNYEPSNIRDLYTALEAKITQATEKLNNTNHNEGDKLRLANELYNSNNGALDDILKAETIKAKSIFNAHSELNRYLSLNYTDPNNTPKLPDYESIALDSIKNIDIYTAEKLFNFNTALQNAQTKYDDQRLKIFNWEAHRYNSYKDKFNQFYDFLSVPMTNNVSQDFILKTTGITQAELNQFNNAIHPQASDNKHTNASTYAARLSQSDDANKAWLKTFTNNSVLETLSSVANEFLGYYQNLISIKAIPNLLLGISNHQRIDDQLIDDNAVHNVRYTLNQTASITQELTSRINAYLQAMDPITNTTSTQVRDENDESNLSFTNPTEQSVVKARTDYFNNFKTAVVAIAQAKQELEKIVFGTNTSDQDTLQKVLAKFIDGVTGFDGRSNIHNILKYIASSDQNDPNIATNADKFLQVKNEYAKIANPSIETEQSVANLDKNSASDFDIYSTITKGFDTAFQLFEWVTDTNNTDLFFDFLTQSVNGIINYANIIPKENTTVEKFQQTLDNNALNEEMITIDGTSYKAKKINTQINAQGGGLIGDLFDKFNIFKGAEHFFNTDNVELFVYKSATDTNAQYLRSRLTSDPSIKRGFVNFYFRFNKPASLTQADSAFGTVANFGIKFENVGISFHTLDTLVIDKGNIQNTNTLTTTLFTAEEAGWNNLQAPARLFGAFNKYSALKLLHDDKYFFTESVDDPIDAPASASSDSSPDFRIKVKLTSAYKGYTQVGNTIYWKTLSPNFVDDKGLGRQNTNYLINIISSANNNTFQWRQNYLYSLVSNKDTNKNLLFLPIVIGIPVVDAQNNPALMVISWQILNRFDKTPTTATQNISLGDPDVLRYVYFFKQSTTGKTPGQPTATLPSFYEYIMNKIRFRDFVGLTFEDLRNSSLWNKDNKIEKDTTNSGKGGVGYDDFFNAIGQNGKFDIRLKLH
ncbi:MULTISPECIES: hypothetical protein [unclassified Mycoplasma]|uniref:hypothetical protein n=1 Tax=unclassified Mycoplasma TaxID=2683645 RepID=UPI00211C52E0|nr:MULTISPECIES: hypothetical protein [unclassified Mycoplasma]UUM20099.1 hypothetical protein NPA11_01580 [Mycoplasma sp. 1578d]UUM25079.1 hypothetical protein NPA12_01555 [Mycoplasma sp. 3686d]